MSTAAQQQKFAKFSRLGEHEKLVTVLRTLIARGDLSRSDRGTHWGVTVCPDKLTLMRLNAGNRCHADVVDVGGIWHLRIYVIAKLTDGRVDPHFKLTKNTKCARGFTEVPDSLEIRVPLSECTVELLGDHRVVEAFRAHLGSGSRKTLPNSAWHNSLVDQILDG
jgi:hypothetical protein